MPVKPDRITTKMSNSLNLLSRQQTVKQCMSQSKEGLITLEFLDLRVNSDETTTEEISSALDDISIELEELKIEESCQDEQQRSLTANYKLVEELLDRTVQYIDCSILEIKSSEGLLRGLENFDWIWDVGSWETFSFPNFETLYSIKNKFIAALEGQEEMQRLHQEYEDRRSDLRLAIKNFKIVLEVVDVDDSTLKKLKRQLDEVTSKYTVSRLNLREEMLSNFSARMEVLRENLELLGNNGKSSIEIKERMSEVLKAMGQGLKKESLKEDMENML